MNVCSEIVAKGLCVGCGVCAGICPHDNLKIKFNADGQYNPILQAGCAENCSLCLKVCPVFNRLTDELAEKIFAAEDTCRNEQTGYYRNAYVGYATNDQRRLKSASGGIATSFLAGLLNSEQVDEVISVGKSDKNDRLFDFVICKNEQDVYRTANSKYYPVECSGIIKYIKTTEKRFAIIALPCLVKALRLAMQYDKQLNCRIKFIAGLACGRGKSTLFTDYCAAVLGRGGSQLSDMTYRLKNKDRTADVYDFSAVFDDGSDRRQFSSSNSKLKFGYKCFEISGCIACDDVYAEFADVAFMDAWLPEYVKDYRGHNLMLTRKVIVDDILADHRMGNVISLDKISIDKVIQSQRQLVFTKKTRNAAFAKYLLGSKGARLGLCQRSELFLTRVVNSLSGRVWKICPHAGMFNLLMLPAFIAQKLLKTVCGNPK